jgi:hypothetical protein
MGVLGKTLRSEGGLNVGSLMNLLRGQKDFIKGLLPAGLTGLLGISDIGETGRQAVQAAAAPARKMWPWALHALGAIAALLLWRGMSTREVAKSYRTCKEAATTVRPRPKGLDRPVRAGRSGWIFKRMLPDGVELNIPALGVENKLIGLSKTNSGVDQTYGFI